MNTFFDVNELERYTSEHPRSVTFAFLASRYIELGQIDKALSIAEEGMQKHPDYPFGHFVLGLCYYHLGDLNKAQMHLELSLAGDEKSPKAWKLLGEIKEKLQQPGQAADCYRNYFLLDSFNQDAVEKYQQEEMIEFDAFEKEQGSGYIETTMPDEVEQPSAEVSSADAPSNFDDLFPPQGTEEEEININEKVDEVFKETLGEISIDADWGESTETPESEKGFENIDLIEFDNIETEESGGSSDDEDISAALDEVFAAFETPPEETKAEGKPPAEEVPAESSSVEGPFPEAEVKTSASSEEPVSEGEQSNSDDQDFLDFSSVVEEIISERQEDVLPETEAAETPEKPSEQASEFQLRHEEDAAPEKPEMPEPEQPRQAEDKTSGTTLGTPPIISPTLGEIYIAQGRYKEAMDVFQQLLAKNPNNRRFLRKIQDIQSMIERQKM